MAKKKKKKKRPRGKGGKFLSKRQIAARRAAKKRGKKKRRTKSRRKTKGNPMAKKKKRRRRRKSAGQMSSKQKQEVCLAAAALGYAEENTELTKNLPMYKPDAAGKTSKPVKRHLVYGIAGHFLSKQVGGGAGKWIDRASTALLTVGCFEAGQSKFELEGAGPFGEDNPYDAAEVSGDIDEAG